MGQAFQCWQDSPVPVNSVNVELPPLPATILALFHPSLYALRIPLADMLVDTHEMRQDGCGEEQIAHYLNRNYLRNTPWF